MTHTPSLEARLERVEQVISALTREVGAIRAELGRSGAASAASAASADSASSSASTSTSTSSERAEGASGSAAFSNSTDSRRMSDTVRSIDYERLLGRYGMLGIAVFAAVAAVGSFLSWAISRGYLTLGPAARVVIGLAFAVGIGAWGMKLRKRERSFGSSLIGLALVIVLVVAYAAGPLFHLVPTTVAFVGSALIAWGLTMFARMEDDEPLWCVAFGGAAIAPFATSDGSGSLYALSAYGLMLLVFGCFGIGNRAWPIAWRVFYLATALLAISVGQLADRGGSIVGLLVGLSFPLAVGAAGVLPFAPDRRKRAALRWLALLTVFTAYELAHQHYLNGRPLLSLLDDWILSSAILVLLGLWLLIVDGSAEVEQSSLLARNEGKTTLLDWIDVAIIPLLLAIRASEVVGITTLGEIPFAVAAAMLLGFTWRRPLGAARDAGAFAFLAAAAGVIVELPWQPEVIRTSILLLVLALVALALHRVRPSWSWVWTGGAILFVAAGLSVGALSDRVSYSFPPFVTLPSFAALCVTVTFAIIARFWRTILDACCEALGSRPRRAYTIPLRGTLRTVIAAPWVWAFIWVYVELSMAYSPSISMLLLVTYFAMTAVGNVAVGRMRQSALLRRIGLALAVIAAGTAVYGASNYFDSGIRVIAYLVTSAFLLGIAFWYRRTGTTVAEA